MDVPVRDSGVFIFGPFRLDPIRQTLECDGAPVKLAPRLFETLLFLVRNHGRVVTRDELIQAIWRGRAVDENNLGQAISALRKALQDDARAEPLIVTVPWRGYRLAAPVEFEPPPAEGRPPSRTAAAIAQVPRQPGPMPILLRARLPAALAALPVIAVVLWTILHASQPTVPAPAAPSVPAPPPHSLAVMAFTNMTGDPGQDYFSDGMSEELIATLGRIDALHVAARLSSFTFKGTRATVAEIARALNVGAVLEGSVRRDAGHLRITAELIDGQTGYQLWSHIYDADPGNIFGVQTGIAAAVTTALNVTLLGDSAARLTLGGTANSRAFDAYLRGMQLLNGNAPGYPDALRAFDSAIALDSAYALAHVQRSVVLQDISESQDNPDPAWLVRTQNDAIAEAQRAIALAPDLAVAHAALGRALEEDRFDFAGADAALSRARQLAPNSARANMDYATLQIALGHVEKAVAAAQLAARLDFLAPTIYEQLAGILSDAGRYDDALAALRHASQLRPSAIDTDADQFAEIQLRLGHPEVARAACAGAHDWQQVEWLAIANYALGKPDEALSQLTRLNTLLGETGALQYAEIHAQWHQQAEAVHWLQTAYRLHDPGLLNLKVDRELDPIRATQDFRDIEREMNFPP